MLKVNMEVARATNGRGVHTGSDALVVGVTHDLSMPPKDVQMCSNQAPPPTFSLLLTLYVSFSLQSLGLFFLCLTFCCKKS